MALLDEVPAGAEVVASATLLDAGHAVAPLVAVDRGSAMWVRDGLGRTRRVTLERSDAAHGLALLRLGSPLAADVSALDSSEAAPLRTAREPFAGSVAYAAGYAPGDGAAQWPTLSLGFLGRADAAGTAGDRPLGFALPAGTGGGPVFDAAGRWVGVAAAGATDAPRFIPLSALYALAGDPPAAGPAEDKPVRLSADAVYETAMRVALQLILRQTPWNGAPSPP